MKITDHIKNAKGESLFSFEIVPPVKGQSIQKLYDNIDPLMEFKPPFIDVTTSREEYVYIDKGNGLLERKMTRMRPGTVGICAALMHKYNVDPVPHVLCGGYTREETEYVLVDCHYLGIDNVAEHTARRLAYVDDSSHRQLCARGPHQAPCAVWHDIRHASRAAHDCSWRGDAARPVSAPHAMGLGAPSGWG